MARRLRIKRIRMGQNVFSGPNSSFKSDTKVRVMDLQKVKEADLLNEVSRRGYMSTKDRERLVDHTYKLPARKKPFKIGVISDTHFGSVVQQPTLTHLAYDYFKKQGVVMVINAGDLTDGDGTVYSGHLYELFLHGADKHVQYVVDNYPKANFPTKFINGNHDESFYKSAGMDVGKRITDKRPDLECLGLYGAYINIGNIKIYVMHPDGGGAYAQSYKLQKIVEKLPSGKKPHILIVGHYHNSSVLLSYRNVFCLQMPAMQAQTPFARRKGLSVEMGFVVLEITPDEKGIGCIKLDYQPLFEPIEGDY